MGEMSDSGINLTLAKMELGLVRMIRGAMHAADAGAAAAAGACSPAPHNFRPAAVFTPTPRFESRVVYHPTPRFESRPVYHPTPRLEAKERNPEPHHAEHARITPSPVQPVWNKLPNIATPSAVKQVKAPVVQPDIRHKGTLIDTFI